MSHQNRNLLCSTGLFLALGLFASQAMGPCPSPRRRCSLP